MPADERRTTDVHISEVCHDGVTSPHGRRHGRAWDGRPDPRDVLVGRGRTGPILPPIARSDLRSGGPGLLAPSAARSAPIVEHVAHHRARPAVLLSHHLE